MLPSWLPVDQAKKESIPVDQAKREKRESIK
jgi:hypothetical protein